MASLIAAFVSFARAATEYSRYGCVGCVVCAPLPLLAVIMRAAARGYALFTRARNARLCFPAVRGRRFFFVAPSIIYVYTYSVARGKVYLSLSIAGECFAYVCMYVCMHAVVWLLFFESANEIDDGMRLVWLCEVCCTAR